METAELQTILDKAQNQFNVKVDPAKINLVRLTLQRVIEAKTYPYFTLIMQSLGSMVLGMEAFMKLNPGKIVFFFFNFICNNKMG